MQLINNQKYQLTSSILKEIIDMNTELFPNDINISGETDLFSELGFNSLKLFELLVEIEKRIGINVFEYDLNLPDIRCLNDIIEAIVENKK
jgi:acyl carrier protein